MNGVTEQVQVASQGGKVQVTLTVNNGAAVPVYVPKALYQSTQLFARAFDISQGGVALDYTGPMVKRGPLTKDDFLPVAPGATLRHSIDITASYAFKPGTHMYQLSYAGKVVGDLKRLDAVVGPAPEKVSFTFTP